MCTFLVSQKVPGSGELVIMGVNPEKPHYVVGVISCEFYSANNHHYWATKSIKGKQILFRLSLEQT